MQPILNFVVLKMFFVGVSSVAFLKKRRYTVYTHFKETPMDTLSLHALLNLTPGQGPVALCGSGGKTSLCYALARETLAAGSRTAVTTTTHMFRPDKSWQTLWQGTKAEEILAILESGRLPVCGRLEGGKFTFGGQSQWQTLVSTVPCLYVEADGSRRLPLKFPNNTEPVLLPEIRHIFVVAGLSGLYRPAEQVCHRWALARERLSKLPENMDEAAVAELLWAGYGSYHPQFILNQADTPALRQTGEHIAALLQERGAEAVYILSLKEMGLHYV